MQEIEEGPAEAPQQFVTFVVDSRVYGVPIGAVREIVRWTRVTPLPDQPAHSLGLLNLRGTIVPVHDLRARLTGRPTEPTDTHVVVILCHDTRVLALLVDAVSDILAVAGAELKPLPAGAGPAASLGLVAKDDALVTILSPEALGRPAEGAT